MSDSINWRRELRRAIEEGFDDSELQTLCFDLDIKYESLSGDNFSSKVRELIEYFERKKELSQLISYCKEKLQKVPWEEIEAAVKEVDAVPSEDLPPDEPPPPFWQGINQQTILIGVGGVVVLIIALFFIFRPGKEETASLAATEIPAGQATSETAVPLAAEVEVTAEPTLEATEIPPTSTSAPALEPTVEPTNTPLVAATSPVEPTLEPSVAATALAEPSPEPTVEAAVLAEPTVLYPDGSPLELTYDATSLYLYNPSSARVRVSDLSFEALDNAGRPLIYGMAGSRWTQFYSFVDGFACNGIEPFGVGGSFMRPQFCRSYNATVTPAQNGSEIFWIERSGAVEFRVLWAGEEIARCPLGTQTCQLFVPAP